MEILEVKRTVAGAVQTFPCEAVEVTGDRAVLLYTISTGRRIADLDLPAGTLTVAYFWVGRPYNVYHWLSPQGKTLACYFNVSGAVRITQHRVEWEDLEVDVLVTPDLRVQVLDEDRLPAGLAAERRAEIASARARVLAECAQVVRELEMTSPGLLARVPRV
jgi:predicted RNA-binding protein associated with RNAse of E/G family